MMTSRIAPAPATLKRFNKGPDGQNSLMVRQLSTCLLSFTLISFTLDPILYSRGLHIGKVQFFHWDAKGNAQKSWFRIFEDSLPKLEEIGCTQVWLPRKS